MDTCDKCGKEVRVGDWFACPHERGVSAIERDEIPGGMVVENGFPEPITVYSHSEHRRLLAERGMEIRAKYAGPADKHLKPWHTVDLDAARSLLERGAQARRAQNDRMAQLRAEFPITVTDVRYER